MRGFDSLCRHVETNYRAILLMLAAVLIALAFIMAVWLFATA